MAGGVAVTGEALYFPGMALDRPVEVTLDASGMATVRAGSVSERRMTTPAERATLAAVVEATSFAKLSNLYGIGVIDAPVRSITVQVAGHSKRVGLHTLDARQMPREQIQGAQRALRVYMVFRSLFPTFY